MLQTHSRESHETWAVAKAAQSVNVTAKLHRKNLMRAMMRARRRPDIDAIKKTITDALSKATNLKRDFENSELWKWVQDVDSSPLGSVKNYTKAEATKFWNQIKKALENPVETMKQMLEQWVPELKTIMEDVLEELKDAQIERFFNGQIAGGNAGILDIINLFSTSASIGGTSKPGYERYLDAIVYISQEVEIGQVVGQILEGIAAQVKEVQDAAFTLISKSLAAVDEIGQAVELNPIMIAITEFAETIGSDATRFTDGKQYWENFLADWVEAKTDAEEWWNSMNAVEQGVKFVEMIQAPWKVALVTLGWNSLAMLVGCDGCYTPDTSRSLAQTSNQPVCEDWMQTRLKSSDDSKPAVSASIDEEAGALKGTIMQVGTQVDAWALKEEDDRSSSSIWMDEFVAGVKGK